MDNPLNLSSPSLHRRSTARQSGFLIRTSGRSAHDLAKSWAVGGLAAIFSRTATAPIERVKILMQTQAANPSMISAQVLPYTSAMDCAKRIATEQSLVSFWRGNAANVMRYFPTQAFNFMFLDYIKGLFPLFDPKMEFKKFMAVNVASGSLAGAAALCIVYPLDFARTRLASDLGKVKDPKLYSARSWIWTTVKESGIIGLYRGFGPSLQGVKIYRGAYFGFYDTAKGLLEIGPRTPLRKKWAVAQGSALAAGFISYPFDTVRRKLMLQVGAAAPLYRGALDCWRQVYREGGGVGAFYRGSLLNAARGVGGALVLVLYDEFREALDF